MERPEFSYLHPKCECVQAYFFHIGVDHKVDELHTVYWKEKGGPRL